MAGVAEAGSFIIAIGNRQNRRCGWDFLFVVDLSNLDCVSCTLREGMKIGGLEVKWPGLGLGLTFHQMDNARPTCVCVLEPYTACSPIYSATMTARSPVRRKSSHMFKSLYYA